MHATEKGKLFTSLLASQPDGSVFSFNPQYWINPIWPVEETGVTWTDRYNDINDRQWATEVFVHVYSKPDYQKAIVKSDEQKLNAYLDLREPLNKQPFAGNARLILVDETLVNRVSS